eukprot:1210529-Amorphochlora_amoeboformis.AAC.1
MQITDRDMQITDRDMQITDRDMLRTDREYSTAANKHTKQKVFQTSLSGLRERLPPTQPSSLTS